MRSRRNPLRLGTRSLRNIIGLSWGLLDILLPLSTTFIAWKGLCLVTNSSVPIVCVVSESMAPAFHRGDLLLLWNWTTFAEPGDIPVVWFDNEPLPMVHRIIQTLHQGQNSQSFLTKGDNNDLDDVALYPGQRTSVHRSEVVGFVRGYVPFVGWGVVAFQDNYWVKYASVVIIAIMFLVGV